MIRLAWTRYTRLQPSSDWTGHVEVGDIVRRLPLKPRGPSGGGYCPSSFALDRVLVQLYRRNARTQTCSRLAAAVFQDNLRG